MKNYENEKHIVDIVFVLVLFAMFAFSALALVILGANVYRGVVDKMDSNYASRTESSYIVEKIRTSDAEGNVRIGTFSGRDAVILESNFGERTLCTYLYEYGGSLCELYTDPSYGLTEEDGTRIFAASDFSVKAFDNNLYNISFNDEQGKKISLYVHVRTE